MRRFTPEEFVTVWNNSSIEETASTFGLTIPNCQNIASKLRSYDLAVKPVNKRKRQLSDSEFQTIWNNSSTLEEVSAKTKDSPEYARNIAWLLRKKGFEMKMMRWEGVMAHGQEFSDLWNSMSVREVAKVLNLSEGTTRNYASELRQQGFNLELKK